MIGIYKITNQINGKCYIGQSTNIHKRWNNHRSAYQNQNAHEYNYYLYRAMRKYGIENFTFEVIEECKQSELNKRETYWIDYYDSYKNGYNLTNGGDNYAHVIKITEEILHKIDGYLMNTKLHMREIAEIFDVSEEMIQGINTGRHWRRDINYPIRNGQEKQISYCVDCGKEIDRKAIRCWDCYCKTRLPDYIPDKLELLKLVSEDCRENVAKLFNVSSNTIKRWCKKYNIPYIKKEAIQYIKDNNIIFDDE